MTEITLSFEWETVCGADREHYIYPNRTSKYLKAHYSEPAVYRWIININEQMSEVYYGETENLAKRIDGYRIGPKGQQTNARLKQYFERLPNTVTLRLQRLRFMPFFINGKSISESDLHHEHVRCFLENLLITLIPENVKRLNRSESTTIKKVRQAVKALESLTENDRQAVFHKIARQAQ